MTNRQPNIVQAVSARLEPGEDIWAVYPSSRRSLVATPRRLFLLDRDGAIEVHDLCEYRAVRRARDTLVVVEGRDGASIGVPVDPSDESGLQALTVIGLLLAAEPDRGSPRASPAC